MDAADLRIFEAVARLGSMSRAARELNTVQSNVTTRIRLLEAELQVALFERHSRGIALTPAGQRLLGHAGRVRQALEDARRAVLDDGTPRGTLTIGALETTAAFRLSPVLATYAGAYPDVDLVLRTGTTEDLIRDVLERRLEGAFACGPIEHAELEQEALFREELVVLTAPNLASLDALLARRDLRIVVLRAGCSYRQRLEEILARRGSVGWRRLEFGTLEAILGCVAAGLGITLLPRGLIGPAWRGRVALHELPKAEAMVETVFLRRRDAYQSSALKAFLACARPQPVSVRAAG